MLRPDNHHEILFIIKNMQEIKPSDQTIIANKWFVINVKEHLFVYGKYLRYLEIVKEYC